MTKHRLSPEISSSQLVLSTSPTTPTTASRALSVPYQGIVSLAVVYSHFQRIYPSCWDGSLVCSLDDSSDLSFADYTWLIPDADVVDSDVEGETGAVVAEVPVVEAARTRRKNGACHPRDADSFSIVIF